MSDFLFTSPSPQPGVGKSNFRVGQPGDSNTKNYGTHANAGSLESPLSKSWLFEIVKNDDMILYSFTLIMPPQSISIKEPQRTSITKTFGNAFIDDYGPDNLQITLKVISGTSHIFPTYSHSGRSEFTDIATAVNMDNAASDNSNGYSGKNAFYAFRNKIMRYKDNDSWEDTKLRVYDLADEQAYECTLIDFSLDRTSESPLRYPFTISLFVYNKLDSLAVATGNVIDISADPGAAMDKADTFLDTLKSIYQDIQEIVNSVALLKAKTFELRAKYTTFLRQTTKVLTTPLDIAKNMLELSLTAMGVVFDVYQAGRITFERYVGALELYIGIHRNALKTYGFQISQGWQKSNTIDIEADNGLNISGSTVERSINLNSYEYSGLRQYTIKGTDTLQRIAKDKLGDSALWPYIAAINSKIASNEDLVPGDELFLPIQIDPGEGDTPERFILTEDVTRDPYGTDLKLDANGNLIIQENGDLALISGIENIIQAINLRLNTSVGSMIKQSAFGITSQAGIAGTELAVKYLKMALRHSIIQDPRIASIENIFVSIDNDILRINIAIVVVGSEDSLPITMEV